MDTVINLPECPICLLDLKKDTTETECCKNKFHKKCFSTWILQNPTCPICRKASFIPIKKSNCFERVFVCVLIILIILIFYLGLIKPNI